MELMEKVTEAMSGLERLIAGIPGYKGYKERELRREADKLLREHLARKFEEQWRRLTEIQRKLIRLGKIKLIDEIEEAVMKLQTLIDRIRTATYGYAGFFDAIKVKEEQLDALYDFDCSLLEEVEEVKEGIDKLASAMEAGDGLAEAIAELIATVREAEEDFNRRKEVIMGELVRK
jgi:hypothetical protein